MYIVNIVPVTDEQMPDRADAYQIRINPQASYTYVGSWPTYEEAKAAAERVGFVVND